MALSRSVLEELDALDAAADAHRTGGPLRIIPPDLHHSPANPSSTSSPPTPHSTFRTPHSSANPQSEIPNPQSNDSLILADLLNPTLLPSSVAENHNLSLAQLAAWYTQPHIQAEIKAHAFLCEQRAEIFKRQSVATAHAALDSLIASRGGVHNGQVFDPREVEPAVCLRAMESVRKSASALIRQDSIDRRAAHPSRNRTHTARDAHDEPADAPDIESTTTDAPATHSEPLAPLDATALFDALTPRPEHRLHTARDTVERAGALPVHPARHAPSNTQPQYPNTNCKRRPSLRNLAPISRDPSRPP